MSDITVSVLAFGDNLSHNLNGGSIATFSGLNSAGLAVTPGCEKQVWTLEEIEGGEATFTFDEYFPYLSPIKNRPTTIEFPNLCGVQALGEYTWDIKVSD